MHGAKISALLSSGFVNPCSTAFQADPLGLPSSVWTPNRDSIFFMHHVDLFRHMP